MIEMEHSPLGGSGAHRFINCAGSFLLQREQIQTGQFEDVPSEFAELGTGAHELAANALVNRVEPFEYLSEEFNGFRAGWDGEINLNAVHIYFNACMAILDIVKGEEFKLLVEQTIKLPDFHPLFKGTVDFGVVTRFGVWLRDYKNGEGIGVAAVNNPQLLYYALLLILNDEWLRTHAPHDLPVNLGIVQPNFYGLYDEPEVWVTTLGEVLKWGFSVLKPRMEFLSNAPAYLNEDFISGTHCQFCPVLLECPVMQASFEMYANASEDFVTMLTNEELEAYYAKREDARRFMKVLETTIHARMMTGATIPSAKLVEKQTARVWKPGAAAALEAAFGEQAFDPKKIKSPASIEKLSSRGKEMATEWGYKPDSAGLVVAPLSDRRPEAKPKGNAGVFAEHAARALEDF